MKSPLNFFIPSLIYYNSSYLNYITIVNKNRKLKIKFEIIKNKINKN